MKAVSKNMIKEISKELNIKISDEVKEMIQQDITETLYTRIATAKIYANHANRTTIRKEDYDLVLAEL